MNKLYLDKTPEKTIHIIVDRLLNDSIKVNINESETDRLIPTRHVLTFEEYEEFLAILEDGQRALFLLYYM